MLYEVKLAVGEMCLLASLNGRRLRGITTDGWSVALELDGLVLDVRPEDAHPTGDVDRPMVVLVQSSELGAHHRPIAMDLGRISSVQILSTVISFSPVRMGPSVRLPGGAEIPESDGYGWTYYRPSENGIAIRELSKQA